MKDNDIRLMPISNGTVLDHLPPFTALKVLKILGFSYDNATTIAINTESSKLGKKDLIFIDSMVLEKEDIEKIALIARGATINIIKNSEVERKEKIVLPEKAEGIISCFNPNCITNFEHIPTRFYIRENPLQAKCHYCEKTMSEEDILKNIK